MKKITFLLLTATTIAFFIQAPPSLGDERGILGVRKGHEGTQGTSPQQQFYLDYHALVVGVGDYVHWPKLSNTAKDLKEIEQKLKVLGFNVQVVADPTYLELKSVLNNMVYSMGAEKDRGLLFYYAGHGETVELADGTRLGYIIPKDCPTRSADPMGFDNRAISTKDLEVLALRVKSQHVLMVFDSCFSAALFNPRQAAPDQLTEMSLQPARQFITAGGQGERAPAQPVFRSLFLEGITGEADLNGDGYVTASELGMYLQEKVPSYTKGRQHPQYGKINNPKLDKGDFVFVIR